MQILKVIKKYGWSLEAVAKELGITKGTFSVSINRNPTTQRLIDVANILGCSPAEFFDDWDTAPENKHPKTAEPAPQEATEATNAEASGAERTGAENADGLPFTDGAERQPTATRQEALVCPHCHHAMVITIDTYEQ